MLIKRLLLRCLKPLGVKSYLDLLLLIKYRRHLLFCIKNLRKSRSQFSQDVFVACELNLWDRKKPTGYFVEFGACDGLLLSNTVLFEENYNWNGILAEPGKIWHEKLSLNRSCHVDFRCVSGRSGLKVLFNETFEGEYSTLDEFSDKDLHSDKRQKMNQYLVETVSLHDLLIKYKAPQEITYLSIDTEGSEYEILSSLDLDFWVFQVITIEHNFGVNRSKIEELLSNKGYEKVFENRTKVDDWYLNRNRMVPSRIISKQG